MTDNVSTTKLATPLIEAVPITDLFAEGIDRVELLGEHARMIFWRWKLEGNVWQRHALDFAIVMPIGGLAVPIEEWRNIRIVRPPGASRDIMQ
jgi:hypothetical protein